MYLTFDVGTTSVKTALFDREGKVLHKVSRDYKLNSPKVDWYEVEPETYWSAVMGGFKEIVHKSGVPPGDIKTISGCSQGETVIFLDKYDNALRPAIVWYDNRARQEVDEMKELLDAREFYRTTGLLEIDTTWTALKILWVRNNEKDVFKKIAKIILVEDYIVYRLTGQYVSSSSLICSTALIDIQEKTYWDKTVDYIGIRDNLPRIIDEGSVVGKIKPSISKELGISGSVIVVKGSMDQATGAVGAGNIKPGIVTESTGSALAVLATVEKIGFDEKVRLPYQPHAIKDKYVMLPYAQTSGIVYKWFRDEFGGFPEGLADSGFEELNRLAESVPPGAEGLVFLPFLAGASFPENDTFARGVFFGITLKHGKAHFSRAIMESIGYMLKKILMYVEETGVSVQEIHSMGGGARSNFWLQMKSDICNYEIVKMEEEETPTLGAAILASVKAGDYKTIEEAVQIMVKKGRRFTPDLKKSEAYSRNFSLYNELYASLQDTFRKYA
jgi:xylulokinase